MILRNRIQREVLRRFWERLEDDQDVPSWPVAATDEIRRVPENTSDLIGGLVAEFTLEQLIDTGIAELGGEGGLEISRRLTAGTRRLLVLRDTDDAPPFDLLLADGLLLGEESPAYAMAHASRSASEGCSIEGTLWLVPSVEDVVICRALGMAASTTVGLENLGHSELRRFEELIAIPAQLLSPPAEIDEVTDEICTDSETPNTERETHWASNTEAVQSAEEETSESNFDTISLNNNLLPVEIIVSGWSFALQQPLPAEQIQRRIARLSGAEQFLSRDLSGVAVWIPMHRDIDRLLFCWNLRDRDAFVNSLAKSVQEACFGLSAVVSGEIVPWNRPSTYLSARSALMSSLRSQRADPECQRQAIDTFEQFLQHQIIEPLVEAGVNNPDPILGALRIEFANTSALLQSQAPFLQHDLIQASVQASSRDKRANLDGSIRLRMLLVDRLVRIARELRR